MKKLIITLIIISSISLLRAQGNVEKKFVLTSVSPKVEGMSAERLDRIDTMFNEYVGKDMMNGATAIILRNSKIVYYKSSGYDYDESGEKLKLKRNEIFRIASQTKAITSVAVMMLYEQGKFLLDDPISKYLPEFKDEKVIDKFNEADSSYTTVDAKSPITIRKLLTHTSGIGYPMNWTEKSMNTIYANGGILIMGITTDKIFLKDEIKKLAKLPLGFQPGTQWHYSLGVDVLGRLVEVISGMSLSDFFHKYIFEPLGMNDTYFYIPKDKYNRLEGLYGLDSKKNLVRLKKLNKFNPDFPAIDGTYYSGGAGLSSTAYDYALFLQMLLNGGELNGKRLLSKSTIKMMTENQIGDLECWSQFIPYDDDKFGLGFEVVSQRESVKTPLPAGSFGWSGAYGSMYWVDPVNKIVAQLVLQLTTNNFFEIRSKFISLVYQSIIN